jgi:hypothetical protein
MVLPTSIEALIGPERLALLRHAVLVPCDLSTILPDVGEGEDVVVLVHGFLASAGVFRPLRARLERETGARIATFSHAPGVGIRRIAKQLSALVDRIPPGARITVVGHSLGGIVARWYVQEMGGHERIVRTVSLGSPFCGIDVPQFGVGADLHAQSSLLKTLRKYAHVCGVPHTSIVAGKDTIVQGHTTACLGYGDVVLLHDRGHNQLLFDDEAAGVVIECVKRNESCACWAKPGRRAVGRAAANETVSRGAAANETVQRPAQPEDAIDRAVRAVDPSEGTPLPEATAPAERTF